MFKANSKLWKILAPTALFMFVVILYYQFFVFGKVPFTGDLLVNSYSPWFDYYKFPVKNPIMSDVFSQTFPWKYISVDIFKTLNWPLWNPYNFMGTPFLANYQSAVLYPLNLFLLLPRYFGWGIFIFSQTIIAIIGMYFFLQEFLESKISSMVGAMIFALGGPMTTWIELGTAVHAMAWLPWSLLLAEKYIKTRRPLLLILMALTLTFIVLAGHFQIVIYSFFILTTFVLFRIEKSSIKDFSKKILPFALTALLVGGLCAIQLLPSLDLLNKSIRLNDSYIKDFNYGLLPIKDLVKFFTPDYFGNVTTANYWGFFNYAENSGFLGTLSLPLLIYVIFYLKKTKITIFFFFIFILSLLLTFNNPLSLTLYMIKVPLLTSSYASRALFMVVFSGASLCAFSLNQILISEIEMKRFVKIVGWSLMVLLGFVLGTLAIQKYISGLIISSGKDISSYYLKDSDYALGNFVVSLRNQILPIIITSGLLVFFAFSKLFKFSFFQNRKMLLFSLFILFIFSIDLGHYFLKFNSFVKQDVVFPVTPSLRFLENQQGIFRIGRENAEVLPPNTWSFYKLQSFEGYDPLYLNDYSRFIYFLNNGVINKNGYGRYAELSNQKYSSPFLDAANVTYFLGIVRKNGVPTTVNNASDALNLANYRFNGTGYKVAFFDKSSVILENLKAKPRAYFAKSFIQGPEAKLEEIMQTKSFDAENVIALEKNLGVSKVTGNGSAKITEYSPNKVVIKTVTSQDEILVLADQYEDGWIATVDGIKTPISRVNMILRGIKAPAGEHSIVFTYWPKSFDTGLKVSLASLLILVSFSGYILISKRRS